ncbi:hypothetical protein NHP190002_06630 [Helicobacter ailurogastricus]|uniref:hypothetical protein n=1 Tax=Helicobacter ailurogastricus TaxID=1578720 RepID=UPI00244D9863|nr:hypothetical protein [Helicobacter ailurogastricus]GMB89982.1 hypothetical protein NHP190002_06630 [Helicobacter ailurogastricus]
MKKKNPDWIVNPLNESEEEKRVAVIIDHARLEIEKRERGKKDANRGLKHSQYLSRFSLGTIIRIIKESKLQNTILDLSGMDLSKYDKSNASNAYLERKKVENINAYKVDAVLNLLQILRNRCYHWENILKVRYGHKYVFPYITTRLKNLKPIGLSPSTIDRFLEDLLQAIQPELNTEIENSAKKSN